MAMCFGFLFFLFVSRTFAESSYEDYEEYDDLDWFYDVGRPASHSRTEKCRKDILLIVDTSYSITRHAFNENVKPFLRNLVNDKVLNVGPDGTQIALMIFSTAKKTKMLLNFGDVVNAKELSNKFDELLQWDKIKGGLTRTDVALEKASKTIYPLKSPRNNRPDIDDVIVLITDGAPRGKHNTIDMVKKYSNKLKDNGVLIVAAAIGPKSRNFRPLLAQVATSPKFVGEANFKHMDTILEKLVASSCIKPGSCICHDTMSSPVFLKPGHTQALIHWPIPTFTCKQGRLAEIRSTSVNPPVQSPHEFPVGRHTIVYTFKLRGNVNVACPVTLNVKGEKCRGVVFNSKSQVCCCGTIHRRKSAHACCGPDYYNTNHATCCGNANLISNEMSCPSVP